MSNIGSDNTVSSALSAAMNPKTATNTTSTSDVQDRFMKLLVTQMQNQDPLNPMDNAQVTSQMAQLSTVSGIDKLNATVSSLQSNYQSGQTLQATSLIGRGVLALGSDVTLSGGKAVLGVELPSAADNVTVTIRDAAGKAVHKISLGPQQAGALPLTWDGATDAGAAAADGQYRFDVTATSGGAAIKPTALSFAQVGSVSANGSGVRLNLAGGGSATLSDVRQIL